MNYQCPLCHLPMQLDDRSLICDNKHRFDFAKEGYINLLPVHKKKSKDPGDNKQMMMSRRQFLDAGYYQFLRQRVCELAENYTSNRSQILDIGCGEGYYTQGLCDALAGNEESQVYGLDISRSALRYASKRYKNIHFCVASSYDLPFSAHTFDLILRVYAPTKAEEISRVTKSGGVLITVSPGKTHHYTVKKMIYSEPKFHDTKLQMFPGFKQVHQENLVSELCLPAGEMTLNFLEMTPYAWKFTHEKKLFLSGKGIECELDFLIEVFRKD